MVASITRDVKQLCTSATLRGAVSYSHRKKLTTCAEESEKKITEEINAIEKEREAIEAEIKEALVKNNISWFVKIPSLLLFKFCTEVPKSIHVPRAYGGVCKPLHDVHKCSKIVIYRHPIMIFIDFTSSRHHSAIIIIYVCICCNIGYSCLLAILCTVTIGMQLMLFISHNIICYVFQFSNILCVLQCTPVITIGSMLSTW